MNKCDAMIVRTATIAHHTDIPHVLDMCSAAFPACCCVRPVFSVVCDAAWLCEADWIHVVTARAMTDRL